MIIKQLRVLAAFNVAQAAKTIDRRMRARKTTPVTPGKVSVIVPYKFIGVTDPNKDIQLLLKLCATLYDNHACFAMLLTQGMLVIRWPLYFNNMEVNTKNGLVPNFPKTASNNQPFWNRLKETLERVNRLKYATTVPVLLASDFYTELAKMSVTKTNLLTVTSKALAFSLKQLDPMGYVLWGQYNQYIVPFLSALKSPTNLLSKIPLITDNQGAIVSPGKKTGAIKSQGFKVGFDLLQVTRDKSEKETKAGICEFLAMAVEKTVADLDPADVEKEWWSLRHKIGHYSFDTEDDAKSMGLYCAGAVVDAWASSATDRSSVNMQRAVQQMFKVNTGKNSFWAKKTAKKGIPTPELYTALATAMYKRTQAMFKEKGIKGLYLARGMELDSPPQFMNSWTWEGTVNLNPLSSFSSSVETARNFGKIVLGGYFKAEQIFCSATTGMGCLNEQEFLVIGGPHKVKGINISADYSIDESFFKEIPAPPKLMTRAEVTTALKGLPGSAYISPFTIAALLRQFNASITAVDIIRQGKVNAWAVKELNSMYVVMSGVYLTQQNTPIYILDSSKDPYANSVAKYFAIQKPRLRAIVTIWKKIDIYKQFTALFTDKVTSSVVVGTDQDDINIDDQQTNEDWIKLGEAPNVDDEKVNADWIQIIHHAPKEKGKQYDAWVKKYNLSEKQAERYFRAGWK